ncbi:MAG: hypothetical protein KatS3mg002_0275 [Candidatus Woesearchaeota archaeon]|nr:MAG: hypothetical protein KatS3mg002_0275 [Candidatus Woesearchaeota archaeon]
MLQRKIIEKLKKGEVVDLNGLKVIQDEGPLQPGDIYVAERNTGPKLLTVKNVDNGIVIPTTPDYCYNIWECVKVKEADH